MKQQRLRVALNLKCGKASQNNRYLDLIMVELIRGRARVAQNERETSAGGDDSYLVDVFAAQASIPQWRAPRETSSMPKIVKSCHIKCPQQKSTSTRLTHPTHPSHHATPQSKCACSPTPKRPRNLLETCSKPTLMSR